MNSAAKLRTRGIAALGATALIATAFGPAAMAFDSPPGDSTTADHAGIASVGLIDADRAKPGTQGAAAVRAGVNNQAIGDVRFVFPGTWQANDTLTFTLGATSGAPTFSSLPTVNIDEKAYAASTHINVTSTTKGGSVETGDEQAYDGDGSPVAPKFTTRLSAAGEVEVTFTNSSATNAKDAKFIGAINGAQINVPAAGVSGDVSLQMAGTGLTIGNTTADRDTTYPATIVAGALTVENGGVLADGTDQYVGPITVTGAAGAATVTIDNGTFKSGGTARAYNQAGTDLGPVATTGTGATLTYTAPANTARVVITNATVNLPEGKTSITYSLTQVAGVAVTTTGTIPGTPGATDSQTDIQKADVAGLVVTYRVSAATDARIAGTDRYETAARIAASALGGSPQTPKGKVDNVVIASGENYADALSAGYLAATQKASLILTQKGELSLAAQNFLRTYGAKKVFIVGGPAAVSPAVEAKLRELPAYDVRVATDSNSTTEEITYTQNMGTATIKEASQVDKTAEFDPTSAAKQPQVGYQGPVSLTVDRSGTNVTITNPDLGTHGFAATMNPASPDKDDAFTLILTRQGKSFELAVPANVTSSANQAVTFNASYSTQTVKKPTTGSNDTPATVTGENRAVVATSSNLEVVRLQGENRFVTNRNVNEYALRNSSEAIGSTTPEYGKAKRRTGIIVNGLTPWDALTSGVLVGSTDTSGGGTPNANNRPKPIILTMGAALEGQAKGQLSSLNVQHAILVGGTAVLPEGLVKELSDRDVTSARLAGANRWETAKAVGDFVFRSSTGSTRNVNPGFGFANNSPYLANGGVVNGVPNQNKWADALAVGPAASKFSRVITLTDSANLPEATKALYQAHANQFMSVIPVGGTEVVSNAVVAAANALAHAR